jgi:uncharacterized spore protein YtfJ
MEAKEFMQTMMGNFTKYMNINLVFGEAKEIRNRTLIPVAKVAFGFGFGSKHGMHHKMHQMDEKMNEGAQKPAENTEHENMQQETAKQENPNPEQQNAGQQNQEKMGMGNPHHGKKGMGGGAGAKIIPIGMFEISDSGTRFIPAISAKEILMGMGLIGFMLHAAMHMKMHKQKHRGWL